MDSRGAVAEQVTLGQGDGVAARAETQPAPEAQPPGPPASDVVAETAAATTLAVFEPVLRRGDVPNNGMAARAETRPAPEAQLPRAKQPPQPPTAVDSRGAVAEQVTLGQGDGVAPEAQPPGPPASDVVAETAAATPLAVFEPVLRRGDVPNNRQPPRAAMRSLLLRLTEEMAPDICAPLYREIHDTPETPWKDYLLTLPDASQEVVFQHGAVVAFGVCAFPAEPDPNTQKARVDFVATMEDGATMVRLHPGRTQKQDAKPILGNWSRAIQNRLNYARNRGRADQTRE